MANTRAFAGVDFIRIQKQWFHVLRCCCLSYVTEKMYQYILSWRRTYTLLFTISLACTLKNIFWSAKLHNYVHKCTRACMHFCIPQFSSPLKFPKVFSTMVGCYQWLFASVFKVLDLYHFILFFLWLVFCLSVYIKRFFYCLVKLPITLKATTANNNEKRTVKNAVLLSKLDNLKIIPNNGLLCARAYTHTHSKYSRSFCLFSQHMSKEKKGPSPWTANMSRIWKKALAYMTVFTVHCRLPSHPCAHQTCDDDYKVHHWLPVTVIAACKTHQAALSGCSELISRLQRV